MRLFDAKMVLHPNHSKTRILFLSNIEQSQKQSN